MMLALLRIFAVADADEEMVIRACIAAHLLTHRRDQRMLMLLLELSVFRLKQ
jgi:hypothetical protein